jgi:hypothetical protein
MNSIGVLSSVTMMRPSSPPVMASTYRRRVDSSMSERASAWATLLCATPSRVARSVCILILIIFGVCFEDMHRDRSAFPGRAGRASIHCPGCTFGRELIPLLSGVPPSNAGTPIQQNMYGIDRERVAQRAVGTVTDYLPGSELMRDGAATITNGRSYNLGVVNVADRYNHPWA